MKNTPQLITRIILSSVLCILMVTPNHAQDCSLETFFFRINSQGNGLKAVMGSNFEQSMEYMITYDFAFKASNPDTLDSGLIQYDLTVYDSCFISFLFDANEIHEPIPGIINETQESSESNYTYVDLPYIGELYLNPCTKNIDYLHFPLSFGVVFPNDNPIPAGIEYSGVLDDSTAVLIAMHYPWQFWEHDFYFGTGELQFSNELPPATLELFTNNRFLATPKKLATAIEGQSTESFGKICADGSDKTTMLKLDYCLDDRELLVRIKEDPMAESTHIYGAIIPDPEKCNTYYLKHPDCLLNSADQPSTNFFETFHIEVIDEKTSELIMLLPIRIYKAPVVMIHGLWSTSSAFDEMTQKLINSGWVPPLTYAYDYEFANSFHFSQTRYLGIVALKYALDQAVENNFSTSRINLIGHSMGGLISRMFIQSENYQNDIARFITLNTPHSGSQMADLLSDLLKDPATKLILDKLLMCTDRNPYEGAIEDLSVNSSATLELLNGTNELNNNIVPSHAITTETSLTETMGWMYDILVLVSNATAKPIDSSVDGLDYFLTNILFNGPHDLIVARASQNGGCASTSHFLPQWHSSTENPEILNKVAALFNEKPDGGIGSFSNQGFDPPKLDYLPDVIFDLPSGNGNITITDPNPGTFVLPGSLLNVNISGTGDVNSSLLSIGSPDIGVYIDYEENQNSNIIYNIPETAYGRVNLNVVGIGEGGLLDNDSSFVIVKPDADLLSISALEDTVYVYQGGIASVTIKGDFSDGIVRKVTSDPGITFEMADESIAEMIENGLLKGISPDQTFLTVALEDLSITLPVIVYPQSSAPLAINIEESDDVSCFGGNDGSIALGAIGGFPNYTYSWSNGGSGPIQSNLTAGLYSITVTDFIGHSQSIEITLEEPAPIDMTFSITDVDCFGANTGSAAVQISGGNPPYIYNWNIQPSSADSTLQNLAAGTYLITVIDAALCESTSTVIINEPDSLAVILNEITNDLDGNAEGLIDLSIQGGTPPFSFEWSLNGALFSNEEDIENLATGVYYLTVKDVNECVLQDSFVIDNITNTNEIIADFAISFYPNPVDKHDDLLLSVSSARPQKIFIRLYGLAGRSLFELNEPIGTEEKIFELPMPNSSGIYLLEVKSDSGNRVVQKIEVQ